jgi:large conductance mechanosensitive channel
MEAMKSFFKEFEKFALKGSFIDLAVGIVIGASFNAVTTSLVNDIITPPLGLVMGHVNFKDLAIPLGGTAAIQYGLFLQAIMTFFLTALALFLIVRSINRMRELAKHRDQQDSKTPPAPADTPELSVLKEIRDTLKGREDVQQEDSIS